MGEVNSGIFEDDWQRGSRGWGTVVLTLPSAVSFQQNPKNFDDSDEVLTPIQQQEAQAEIDETAADMFLNWVYRENGIGGFENIDRNGDVDSTEPGTTRLTWMRETIDFLITLNQWD